MCSIMHVHMRIRCAHIHRHHLHKFVSIRCAWAYAHTHTHAIYVLYITIVSHIWTWCFYAVIYQCVLHTCTKQAIETGYVMARKQITWEEVGKRKKSSLGDKRCVLFNVATQTWQKSRIDRVCSEYMFRSSMGNWNSPFLRKLDCR